MYKRQLLAASAALRKQAKTAAGLVDALATALDGLDSALDAGGAKKLIAAMTKVRKAADELEAVVPADMWPLPSYAEMFFG